MDFSCVIQRGKPRRQADMPRLVPFYSKDTKMPFSASFQKAKRGKSVKIMGDYE